MDAAEAWAAFTTPPAARPTAEERRVLGTARRLALALSGPRMESGRSELAAYAWGEGPTVLFAHGWGGHAGQLGPFVRPLVERGFGVVAVDAPAHGASGGRRTNIYEFAATVSAAAGRFGPLHAVVGHSLGAAGTVIALGRGLAVGRVVLVAATARLRDEVLKFTARVALPTDVEEGLLRHMEGFRERIWEETSLARIAPRIDVPALVVHDEHDPDVAFGDGAELALRWRGPCELFRTSGLGHLAPLRSREVVERVAEYVASAPAAGSVSG